MIRFFIHRPVAAAMVYLALSLLGVASWLYIPVELLPDAALPRLRVVSSWRGASPESPEALITSPLEAAVQQVRGTQRVWSESEERNGTGLATVDVEFARGVDMDFARLELSERLAVLASSLPRGASSPRVEPYLPPEFAAQTLPFLRYTVTGPYTPEALREQVEERIA
ncbi:MAG: efflux RND transporter permease subunit, partial [Gemmatimonadetes bacterium]|nr:efflux RND transporter permease subunit [Gemmatimonadota bacterium]